MRRITKTYDIVTPESAEQGDYAETGWEDEQGATIEPDAYDLEEYETEFAAVVALAVKHIGHGVEPSDWPRCCPGHTWYTDSDGDTDYRTGAVTRYSYHLKNFTPEEETAIYAELTGKPVRR